MLMRDFHMSEHAALDYPLNRAFALAAWNLESNPHISVQRKSDGYIAQEAARFAPRPPLKKKK